MTRSLFDFVANLLEQRTDLDGLEARGTLRIALRQAGFEAKSLAPHGVLATLEQVLPAELAARAVADPHDVCAALADEVRRGAFESEDGSAPEDVFRRLVGD